jgi:hypothetical protein
MADGQEQSTENENTSTQTGGEVKKVELTQEDLNNLINSKYAKGAEKATKELLESLGIEDVDTLKNIVTTQKEAQEAEKTELQKMQEQLEALQNEKSTLEKTMTEAQKNAKINSLAAQHGIKEIDYFRYEFEKASGQEGFNEETFISGLLSAKGALLGINSTTHNVPNPQSQNNQKGAIRRSDFEKLPAADKLKLIKSGSKILD